MIDGETRGQKTTSLTWETVLKNSITTCAHSFDYTMTLIKRENNNISFLRNEWSLILKTWISFSRGCFVTSLDRNGPVVLEVKIDKFRQCIFLNASISSLKSMWSLIWTNLNSLQWCFVPSLVEICSGEKKLNRENFTDRQMDRRRTTGNQ